MSVIRDMDLSEFEANLTEKQLMPLKLVSLFLIAGIIIFIGIGIYLYLDGMEEAGKTGSNKFVVDTMLVILGLLFIAVLFAAKIIPSKMLLGKINFNVESGGSEENIDPGLRLYLSQHIVKLSMLEGASIFGGVILILAVKHNLIYSNQYMWLCLVPAGYQLIFSLISLPDKDKVISLFRETKEKLK